MSTYPINTIEGPRALHFVKGGAPFCKMHRPGAFNRICTHPFCKMQRPLLQNASPQGPLIGLIGYVRTPFAKCNAPGPLIGCVLRLLSVAIISVPAVPVLNSIISDEATLLFFPLFSAGVNS